MVVNFLLLNDINWRYILSLSRRWGGFYELLISIVESTLRKSLGNAKLNYEELLTALTETECVVNSNTEPVVH